MRIVQLLTQDVGGPVDHAADVARGLHERGHASHLVGPDSAALDRAEAAGVTVHRAAMRHKSDLRGARDLARLLRGLEPDVLHLQDRRAGLVGRVLPTPAAVVYTLHGVPDSLAPVVAGNAVIEEPRRRDRWLYADAERLLARAAGSLVVAPSEPLARYARDYVGLPADRVRVVPNGVDTDRFVPGGQPGEDGIHLVWLGVLAPVKRVHLLLDVLDAVPGTRLTLIGDGPLRADLECRIAERGLVDRVRLTGMLADPAPVLREADLFVLPSGAENLPLALLQAMASGLPVVASRVGGIPDVVREGVEGRLVPADRPDLLSAAVADLVAAPERLPALGRAARARVETAYSLEGCVDGLVEVYAEARGQVRPGVRR
ncbi:glycosyltransferase family 4 protein [Alteromonas gracilis]